MVSGIEDGPRLKEHLFNTNCGFALEPNSFLFELVKKLTDDLISAGILQYLREFHKDYFKPKTFVNNLRPETLKIDDLQHYFIIWLIACSFAILTFLLELFNEFVIVKVKKIVVFQVQRVFAIFMFLKVLKIFLKPN